MHDPGPSTPATTAPAHAPAYAVVVPTVVRDTLADCLAALAAATGPEPREIVLVDDRPAPDPADLEHPLAVLSHLRDRTTVLYGHGHGPSAARNTGLRAVASPWVVFLDDDVQVGPHWCEQLAEDLRAADPDTAAVQGVIDVPLPGARPPTDWERDTVARARARWSTADMAYRTDALKQVHGFDERFRRSHRDGTDLALRLLDDRRRIRQGRRSARHPVHPADRWASVRAQRGHADDALMLRLHGPGWWHKAVAPRGPIRAHLAVTATGAAACALAVTRHRGPALAAGLVWAVGTAEYARARILPGPRTRDEVTTVVVTSALIPPTATWHWLSGLWRHRRAPAWQEVA